MENGSIALEQLCDWLETFAPLNLAESWDNVGLLLGDRLQPIRRVMTCLTITPESATEALERGADLVIAHHPLPFRPLKRITTDDTVGTLLLALARSGAAIYSPHTSFDSAREGINAQLAAMLELRDVQPITPHADDPSIGAGRLGVLEIPESLAQLVARIKALLGIEFVTLVGSREATIERVAIACGSAGEFLPLAADAGCDVLVTGEVSFHTALEASARGMALVLVGHYASERFALETLAARMASEFPMLEVWASEKECDPMKLG